MSERKTIDQTIYLPYKWALGPTYSRFFDELKNKRIFGTKCPECGKTLVPARKFCPKCYVDMRDWVQVSENGRIKTWSLVNFSFTGQVTKPPYIVGLIDLEGADNSLTHLIGGVDLTDVERVGEKVDIGMRVKAKWKKERTGHILDIEYFELSN